MRSTKGWEEGWLLLFFCTSHDGLLQFLEEEPKEEDEIIVKEMRNFDCEWNVDNNVIFVNNMASPFLYFYALCVTHVMKGIIAKLTTYVLQYILNEKPHGHFFILTSHQIT